MRTPWPYLWDTAAGILMPKLYGLKQVKKFGARDAHRKAEKVGELAKNGSS